MEERIFVRLVCSLKAVTMLVKRIWTQKPMRSHRAHFCLTGTLPIEREERYSHGMPRRVVSVTVKHRHERTSQKDNETKQKKTKNTFNVRPDVDVCFE